jgi:poly(3-hydroxybutyrate) depolymerase
VRICSWLLLICLALSSAASTAAEQPRRETFKSGKATRVQSVYVPKSLSPDAPAPLLVLLHGSGGTGAGMAREWLELASRERFIIAAPESSDDLHWRLKQDSPDFIRHAIEAVDSLHPIDPRRIYLFGHSGGAVYALTLAMLESEYFAAVAIHAGAWREAGELQALQLAKRKIPIALFVGDRDEFFPLRTVQQTAQAIEAAGHPSQLTVIPRHRHSYREAAAQVNPAAWTFLTAHSLDGNPKFQSYE